MALNQSSNGLPGQNGPIPTLRPVVRDNTANMKHQMQMAEMLKNNSHINTGPPPGWDTSDQKWDRSGFGQSEPTSIPISNADLLSHLMGRSGPTNMTGNPNATPYLPQGGTLTPDNWEAFARRVGAIESSNNPFTPSNHQGNRGLYQWSRDLEARYGINDNNWNDPNAQNAALRSEMNEFTPRLTSALGRSPTMGEYYFTHQQGPGGGPALLAAAQNTPGMPAWQAVMPFYGNNERVARSAITNNPYTHGMDPDVTASDFATGWVSKFENGM